MIYRLIRAMRSVGRSFASVVGLLVAIGAVAIVALGLVAWALKAYEKRPDPSKSPPKVDATGKVATCPAGRFLVRFPPGTEPELVCLSGSVPSWEKPSDALKKGGRQ